MEARINKVILLLVVSALAPLGLSASQMAAPLEPVVVGAPMAATAPALSLRATAPLLRVAKTTGGVALQPILWHAVHTACLFDVAARANFASPSLSNQPPQCRLALHPGSSSGGLWR